MADVSLIRVDFRLIHGQVAVKWTKVARATKIIVVDDDASKNATLKAILKLAAPQGTKCLVYSVERCAEKWKEKKFGEGRVMMVFKEVSEVYKAWKAGLDVPKLQLGNIPNQSGRKVLHGEVYVNEEEMRMLTEMSQSGTEIEIHTIPEVSGVSFERAKKKY